MAYDYFDDDDSFLPTPTISIIISRSREDALYEKYCQLVDKGKTTAKTFNSWMRMQGYCFDTASGYWFHEMLRE